MDSDSTFSYSAGLQRLRRRRKITWYLFFGWFLLILFMTLLFLKFPSSAKYFTFVAIIHFVAIFISAFIPQYSECPRCKDKVNGSHRSFWNKYCQNCGLNINADRLV
jgi:hypothetical protein